MGSTGGSNIYVMIIWIAFFIGLIYFMIILPQKRRDKKTRLMLDDMKTGNDVITIGGVCGKVINIKDDEVTIETSVEKTKINVKKWGIREVVKPIEG